MPPPGLPLVEYFREVTIWVIDFIRQLLCLSGVKLSHDVILGPSTCSTPHVTNDEAISGPGILKLPNERMSNR